MLTLAGGTVATALVAGCTEGTGDGNDVPPSEQGEPEGDLDDVANDSAPSADRDEWADVDTIELEATTDGWTGRAPAHVDGDVNPTLLLAEGREYKFVWTNADGETHGLALRNDDYDEVASTEMTDDEGGSLEFTVEATSEMTLYLCLAHGAEMAGGIETYST
ncbi:hypothetical protein ACFOZ7_04750 [Natribaculum luteum]|uniref:Blue (type 1) copper domain-containing protein n=1 Tax=Natribaculum luteum TaxID=1586232 RepID=A0ABD5NW31_9EURY|nr:hypothetical protein [Natribaculum luteum]